MRTDAARGVYARRGNLPVLGGKIWLILYCLRRSFVQMTVCRYGAYCRRWKIVRSSIKSGGLPGYPESTYSGPGLRGLHLRDGRSANGLRIPGLKNVRCVTLFACLQSSEDMTIFF